MFSRYTRILGSRLSKKRIPTPSERGILVIRLGGNEFLFFFLHFLKVCGFENVKVIDVTARNVSMNILFFCTARLIASMNILVQNG